MRKIATMALKIILGLLGTFILATLLFLGLAPQLGKAPTGEDLLRIQNSPHFEEGRFVNELPTQEGSLSSIWQNRDQFFGVENTSPNFEIPTRFGPPQFAADSLAAITWYGHSAFLMEIQSLRILIDPMLGDYAAPISFGSQRFPYEQPIPIEELTDIDLMILSHDHYDHLDYPTILRLKDQVKAYFTPLGLGAHLKHWGISSDQIHELDWWESLLWKGLEISAAPARHFSGRGLWKRNSSQWASWIIKSRQQRIYFSGDGGYGPHFKEIGAKHGPFDLALLECGQYNKAWSQIHMMPEESVKAGGDLEAELIMPIHWGAFQLAVHEWTEPIKRFKKAAKAQDQAMVHPYIGERFILGKDFPREEWWHSPALSQTK